MTQRCGSFARRMATMAILLLGCGAAAKANMIISSPAPSVIAGSVFEVDVIAASVNLGGYQLSIGFSPLLASLTSVSFDVYLGSPLSFTFSQQNIDSVDLSEVSFADASTLQALQGNPPGNQYSLVRLMFHADSPGVAQFTFLTPVLTDYLGDPVTTTYQGTSVTITDAATVTPEPATFPLMGMGLAAAVWIRRRLQVTPTARS
jgi:hypothetical protein